MGEIMNSPKGVKSGVPERVLSYDKIYFPWQVRLCTRG